MVVHVFDALLAEGRRTDWFELQKVKCTYSAFTVSTHFNMDGVPYIQEKRRAGALLWSLEETGKAVSMALNSSGLLSTFTYEGSNILGMHRCSFLYVWSCLFDHCNASLYYRYGCHIYTSWRLSCWCFPIPKIFTVWVKLPHCVLWAFVMIWWDGKHDCCLVWWCTEAGEHVPLKFAAGGLLPTPYFRCFRKLKWLWTCCAHNHPLSLYYYCMCST